MSTLKTALFWICSPLLIVAAALFIGVLLFSNRWIAFMEAWSFGQDAASHFSRPDY